MYNSIWAEVVEWQSRFWRRNSATAYSNAYQFGLAVFQQTFLKGDAWEGSMCLVGVPRWKGENRSNEPTRRDRERQSSVEQRWHAEIVRTNTRLEITSTHIYIIETLETQYICRFLTGIFDTSSLPSVNLETTLYTCAYISTVWLDWIPKQGWNAKFCRPRMVLLMYIMQ